MPRTQTLSIRFFRIGSSSKVQAEPVSGRATGARERMQDLGRMRLQHIIRTSGAVAALGFVLALPASAPATTGFHRPTTYRTTPERACHYEWATVSYPPGQSGPRRRKIADPGAPGLTAVALSSHVIRVNWTLTDLPAACKVAYLLLSVGRYPDRAKTKEWLPTTTQVLTHGRLKGSARITYASFFAPPDVALASAFAAKGGRSHVVAVLIRR
jgi:hypothetical protein